MHQSNHRLPDAYEKMIERASNALYELKDKTTFNLHHVLEESKQKAVYLGELSHEEAAQIAKYIHRDLYDAARHVLEQERDFSDCLKLEILLIEEKLIKRISSLIEVIRHVVKEPTHPFEWHTGEVTGIGVLKCKSCGKELHFHQVGHIPPCPKCHKSHFQRCW